MNEKRIAIILDADGRAAIATFDQTTGAVTRMDDATEKLNRTAARNAVEAQNSGKKWEQFGRTLGQGLVVGSTALALLFKHQIDVMDATEEMAARIGVSTEFISEMGYAAKMAGGDSSFLEAALARLEVASAKAEQGAKGPSAAFRSLGIDVRDAEGKVKSLEQLLPQIADKFKAMPDGPREAAVAVALFGREGRKMLPLLNEGAEGIEKLRTEARRLGLSVSTEMAAAAGVFNDNMDRMMFTVRGLVSSILQDALPAMVELSGELVDSSKQASTAGAQYGALGLLVKGLGTIYYFVATIVETGTTRIAVAIDTVKLLMQGASSNIATFFAGVTDAASHLMTGDLTGAFGAFKAMQDSARANNERATHDIGDRWRVASELTGRSIGDFKRKVDELWNPAAIEAGKKGKEGAEGADALGDGFLGAGRKAAEAADKAQKAMQRLRELVRDQQNETLSNVGQADNKNASTKDQISQLEKETAGVSDLAERQQLLAQARTAAAAAHEKALRIAQAADDERARELDIVGSLLKSYREEAPLAVMNARQREVEQLVLQGVNKAREQYAAFLRASPTLTAAETAELRKQAAAYIEARDASQGLRDMRESQQDEINTLRATVKAGGELTTAMKAELQIRKLLHGMSAERIKASEKEIELIRQQAREIDTLNAQGNIQSAIKNVFGAVIDGQQQGRSAWDSFRNEGVRAMSTIGGEILKLRKSTGSWGQAFKEAGKSLEEILPALGQLAGTAAGGGGSGAALGSSIGGMIGSYFGGAIGSVIGSLIGGWAGGTFDEDPSIRVGRTVSKPEQTRTSRFQTFQVRTESMTEPTSSAVADAIVEFDSLIYDMMTTGQRAAVRATLQNFSADSPVLTDLLKQRMNAVLGSIDKSIGDFVRGSSTDLQRQMQNLSEVLTMQRLESEGDLLTGTLSRALQLIEEFGRAGESAGQTYQRLAQIATNYGSSMTDINKQVIMHGLNDYQRSQVEIELQYRNQIKQANDLAKAMGLSGARAEDLAKIEQLRAINMADVQRQIEAERARVLTDLSLSDLSPLRDEQKLGRAMQELRSAVSTGDMSRAQELAQSALGFGRSLFASGADYNSLYSEVTGLLQQVNQAGTQPLSETQLDTIADLLMDLPEQIARALFDQLYATIPAANRTPTVTTPPSTPTPPTTPPITTPPVTDVVLKSILDRLAAIEANTASTANTNAAMNSADSRRELAQIGTDR
ncbi:MAG: hypothetical protein ABL934_09900 [Lysobacteraceae bacterium]